MRTLSEKWILGAIFCEIKEAFLMTFPKRNFSYSNEE